MNTSFSFSRIAALLKYDWAQDKRRLGLAIGLLYAVFAVLAVFKFSPLTPTILAGKIFTLPQSIGLFVENCFGQAQNIMILVVTVGLIRKFANRDSAVLYLTLPASPLEKFTVALLDYIIVYAGLYVLYIISFYLMMGIGCLLHPSLDWAINVFTFDGTVLSKALISTKITTQTISDQLQQATGSELALQYATEISSTLRLLMGMTYVFSIGMTLYYMILNLCFKTNHQLKSIICLVLTGFVLIVGAIICTVSYLSFLRGMVDAEKLDYIMGILPIIKFILWCIPFITLALGYVLYHKIRYKQA